MKMQTMQLYPEVQQSKGLKYSLTMIQVLLGCLYISLLSHIEIPMKPVPMTLQTFAIFSLGLFQGSKKAFFSLVLYLAAATLGLPVLSTTNLDLWIFRPTAGYCLSFPFAAYLAGRCTESKQVSFMRMVLGLGCAQTLIYLLGVTWLSLYTGWTQALMLGFYPFIVLDIVKLFAAISIKMIANPIVKHYQIFMNKIAFYGQH